MAVTAEHRYSVVINPFHALLLGGALPLYLGALLCDIAYARTYEIQWSNFASWLIVGALVFSGVALLFALVDLMRDRRRARGFGIYILLLLATWLVGLFDVLMHARDAWAVMPMGLVLSVICSLLISLAAWFGFATPRVGDAR